MCILEVVYNLQLNPHAPGRLAIRVAMFPAHVTLLCLEHVDPLTHLDVTTLETVTLSPLIVAVSLCFLLSVAA